MDDTMSSLLQAIAAYSFPVQQGEREVAAEGQNGKEEQTRGDELTKQLQMLMSENAYLRDTLHLQTDSYPTLRKTSNPSSSPRPRSPISPLGRGKSGSLRFLPGDPAFFAFLQNQISFLRTALNQSQTALPSQPVFIVQGEFYLQLKDALSKSLQTIGLFLTKLNDQGEQLYQTYQDLQGKASAYSVKHAFDAALFEHLMKLVDEIEGFKQKVFAIYTGKIEVLSSEMTNLLQESYRVVISLAGNISQEAEIHELKSWNERKIEISTEQGTFELLLCKRQMLMDLEALKLHLLGRVFGASAGQSRMPRCSVRKPQVKQLPESPSIEPQQMLLYVSTLVGELTEALNLAKVTVATWQWRPCVLVPSPIRTCRNMHDLSAAIKAAKADVEQITKVSAADKPEIEKRVLATLREDELTQNVTDLTAEVQAAQERERCYVSYLEQQTAEIDRLKVVEQLLEEERGQRLQLEATVSNLTESNAALSAELARYQQLYECQLQDITAFIQRVNASVFHSEASTLPEIADLTEDLYKKYRESIETVVMETFEPPLLTLGHGSKLRSSGSDAEAVWKGMKYLVRAAESAVSRAGIDQPPRELSEEISAAVMKAMQHYVHEDLQRVETALLETKEERNTLEHERNTYYWDMRAAKDTIKEWEAIDAEKTAQLRQLQADYDAEKANRDWQTSVLTNEKFSLSTDLEQLRMQLQDLDNANALLRDQLRLHEIPVHTSNLMSEHSENAEISRGAGGGLQSRINKGLDYTIRYLSSFLHRDFELPSETIQKQAVVLDQLREVEKLLVEKSGLHSEVEGMKWELSRLTEEKNALDLLAANQQREIERLGVSHQAQIDSLLQTHLQELSTVREQVSSAVTTVISAEAEPVDMSDGKRLQTATSIEEKLVKGFEYICLRAKAITSSPEELPKEPIDRQKYLYERLEDVERMLADLRANSTAAGELEVRLRQEIQHLQEQLRATSNAYEALQKDLEQHSTQHSTLRETSLKEISDREALINQLRRSLAEIEKETCVDMGRDEYYQCDEFLLARKVKAEYERKIAKGFDYINEKLAESTPSDGGNAGSLLEKQWKMLESVGSVQRLAAQSQGERDQANVAVAELQSENSQLQGELSAQVAKAESDLRQLTLDKDREITSAQEMVSQLRKRFAEVESLVYVSGSTADDFSCLDFVPQRGKPSDYNDKVLKGFKYLNGKLELLTSSEVPSHGNLLENQLEMYKLLVEVQRLINAAQAAKDRAEQEVASVTEENDKLKSDIANLFEQKASELRTNNDRVAKQKKEIDSLKDEIVKREETISKMKVAAGDSDRQLTILRQSIEDLKKENQNLRTQLGTDFLLAYPSDQSFASSDDSPRKHLQSSGSVETRLDKGFELILGLLEPVTLSSHVKELGLIEKQRSVFDNVQKIVEMTKQSLEAHSTEMQQTVVALNGEKQALEERLKSMQESAIELEKEKLRLVALNRSLEEQVNVKELVCSEAGPPEVPSETRSHLQAGQTLEEKLAKGFDYSIQEIAKILGITVELPTAMLDKQRKLFDLLHLVVEQDENVRNLMVQLDVAIQSKENALMNSTGGKIESMRRTILSVKDTATRKIAEQSKRITSLTAELSAVLENCQVHTAEWERDADSLKFQNSELLERVKSLDETVSQLEREKIGLELQLLDYEKKALELEDSLRLRTTALQEANEAFTEERKKKEELEEIIDRQKSNAGLMVKDLSEKSSQLAGKVAKLEHELDTAKQEITRCNSELERSQSQYAGLQSAKTESDRVAEDLKAQIQSLEKTIANLNQELNDTKVSLADITNQHQALSQEKAKCDSAISVLQQSNIELEAQLQEARDKIASYATLMQEACKKINARIPDVSINQFDPPDQIWEMVVDLVKMQRTKLEQANTKWEVLQMTVWPLVKYLGAEVVDLPKDFVAMRNEEIHEAVAHILKILPALQRIQQELCILLSRKAAAISASHILLDADSRTAEFSGDRFLDFLAWVQNRSNTCLCVLESAAELSGSVTRVYRLSLDLSSKFEVQLTESPDQSLLAVSTTTEGNLEALSKSPLEGIKPIQELLLKRTTMIHALGKAAANGYAKRQGELSAQINELHTQLEKERKQAKIVAQDLANVLMDHSATKESLAITRQTNKKHEETITELQGELQKLLAAKRDEEKADSSPETEQLTEIGTKLQRALEGEKRAALLIKLQRVIIKAVYQRCVILLAAWKEFPAKQSDNKYINPQQYSTDPLAELKLSLVRSNPLLQISASQGIAQERPMSDNILCSLASDILLSRVTKEYPGADSLPRFVVEYLTEKLGSRDAAMRQVRQLVPALYGCEDDDWYLLLLARLFQVRNPLNNSLASFFVKANLHMHKMVEKRLEQKAKESKGKKPIPPIDPFTGGVLFLCDALSTVYELKIDEDPNVCRRVLNHMRDPDMDKTDYVTFVINHRLEWLNINTEQFFHHIDPNNKGVAIDSLIDIILSKLQLCISRKKLKESFESKVDRNRSGNIGKEEFSVYMDVTYYKLNAAHETYSIDRNTFLCVLCEVYDMTVTDLITKVKSAYAAGTESALQALLPNASAEDVARCTAELRDAHNGAQPSAEQFITFLATREVQGLFVKPFGKHYVGSEPVEEERALRDRKRNEFFSPAMAKTMLGLARKK